MAAVLALEDRAASLTSAALGRTERFLRESKTWALVDALAANVAGEIASRFDIRAALDSWARDADFWIRRASLLAEMRRLKAGAPFEAFARRADAMLDEKEFFIRKAIGWVLREMSKKRPDEVYSWVAPRTGRVSGVTMREAVKYLDADAAAALMRAYEEGRPLAEQ